MNGWPPGLSYEPDFAPGQLADLWLAALRDELPWQERSIVLFGKPVLSPRLTTWHGEPHARYRYSGLTLEPQAWTPTLAAIRARLNAATGIEFDSVFANLYRDGRDSMGWHADDEPELGRDPIIASVSLGAARRFLLRERVRAASPAPQPRRAPLAIELGHGSLLLMGGDLQHRFVHALPKTARPVGLRINLTWRRIVAPR